VRAALDLAAGRLSRTYGVTLRAGVSSVCHALVDIGRGYGEAKQALRHAPDAGAVAIEEIGLLDYLVEQADDSARRLVPRAAQVLIEEDRRQGGALTATLRAYADCDMNGARAADSLVVHPNTVHYRLGRVKRVSGRDPRRLAELLELLLAIRLSESLANS
jgi:DNA-binding PucR family transcriptional regulator